MTVKNAKRIINAIDLVIIAWVIVGLFTTINMGVWAVVSAILIGIAYGIAAKVIFGDIENTEKGGRYE